tara:strand:- start:42 stop:320 length:279 start_codon:yes stop_codon:yes gene_type:complete
MKKGPFKMKKFSGFGNESPAKNKGKVEVDFNNPNVEKNYKENAEFRKYLKEEKGVTYDPKTRISKTVRPVKKSPTKAGQTAGQIVRRERLMT